MDRLTLDGSKAGCEDFFTKIENECFNEMFLRHRKKFVFELNEKGCVNPNVVAPMIIFTVPHILWNLQAIPIPNTQLPKLVELFNEKIKMGI